MKKLPKLSVIALSFVLILASGCKKENPVLLPVLTTNEVSSISFYSAISGGDIYSDGGSNIVARGVCWSSTATPTIAKNKTSDGGGVGSFTSSITGLSAETTYFVRAYATNSEGTAYGSAYQFKTSKAPAEITTVLIPAGTFIMGSPESEEESYFNEIQHEVTLSAFLMSKYEITNEQYAAFLNAKSIGSDGLYAAGAYPMQSVIYASSDSHDWGLHYSGSEWVPAAGYETSPVINVSWYGAAVFAAYVGGSLPTEAQWEYACRAGTSTPFSTGTCLTNLQANYDWNDPYGTCTNTETNPPGKPLQVGSYAANAYGLYDMHGNLWEWCSDWSGDYPTSAQTNPTGAADGTYRVIRGGGWNYCAGYCRSAFREGDYPSEGYYDLGFRVVFVP